MTDDTTLITAASRTMKTLADGTLRLSLDIEPRDAADAFKLFGAPGTTVALAAIRDAAAQAAQQSRDAEPAKSELQPEKPARQRESQGKGPYSQHARELHRSGFWNAPPLIEALMREHEAANWYFDYGEPADEDVIRESARDILKRRLGYDSWTRVPPAQLRAWCDGQGIMRILPRCYRGQHDNPGDWPPVREVAA